MNRKLMYKANASIYNDCFRERNRNQQNLNRNNQRNILRADGRKIPPIVTPNQENLPGDTTDKCTNKQYQKENVGNVATNIDAEISTRIAKVTSITNEKLTRQQQHLKRFLEWKQAKQQLKELSKNNKVHPINKENISPKNQKRRSLYTFTITPKKENNVSDVNTNKINVKNNIFSTQSTTTTIFAPTKTTAPTTKTTAPTNIVVGGYSVGDGAIRKTKILKEKQICDSQLNKNAIKKTNSKFAHPNAAPTAKIKNFVVGGGAIRKAKLLPEKQKSASQLNKHAVKKTNSEFTRPNAMPTAKNTNIVVGGCSVGGGAIRKAKLLQEKQKKDMPIRVTKNTKLSTNMKAKNLINNKIKIKQSNVENSLKKPVIKILDKTPLTWKIQTNNEMSEFITSTQIKTQNNFMNTASKMISPIKSLKSSEKNFQSKRSLKLNDINEDKNKKDSILMCNFNFLHESINEHEQDGKVQNSKENVTFKTPPTTITNDDRPLNYLSPFVSVSRGKVSAKKEKNIRDSLYSETPPNALTGSEKEFKKPHSLQFNNSNSPTVDTRNTLEAVRYFRKQLENEIIVLHALCDKWETYKMNNIKLLTNTGGDDIIDGTIGQTKLLTSKKFIQFKGLIDRCEANANGVGPKDDGSEATKLITAVDLEGFWSMLKLQMENLEKRFENLNRWMQNNWLDPDEIKKVPIKKKKTNITKSKKPTKVSESGTVKVSSGIQEMKRRMYAEMRKNKANEEIAAVAAVEATLKTSIATQAEITSAETATATAIAPTSTSKRMSRIVIKDRKYLSIAKTVLTISPMLRRSTSASSTPISLSSHKKKQRDDLRKSVLINNVDKLPDLNDLEITPEKRNKRNLNKSECKSILKTPGTANKKDKSVNFDKKLHVRNFNFLLKSDEEDLSIEELEYKKATEQNNLAQNNSNKETNGSYSLRNRKVNKRPSCEIIIPKG